MSSLLLVHGGWQDRHCWDLLRPHLSDRGIDAHTVTMPGNGDTGLSPFRASMSRSADAICNKAREIGGPITVLGHSMGGYSITAAAERCPDLFSKLIYLTAWIPPMAGDSMYQFDKNYGEIITGPLVEKGAIWKPWFGRIDAHPEHAAKFLCPLAPVEAQEFLFKNTCPQPIRPGLSKVPWTAERTGRIPKAYIECTKDLAIPLEGQRHFQKNSSFEEIASLESDHCPFLSMPEQLAECIEGLVS